MVVLEYLTLCLGVLEPFDNLYKLGGYRGCSGFGVITIDVGGFLIVLERLALCVDVVDPSDILDKVGGGGGGAGFIVVTINARGFVVILERLILYVGMVGAYGVFNERLVVISIWTEA